MKRNSLQKLQKLGQSIWLDYIRSDLVSSGTLKRLIHKDGLSGMTSNPAIFEKAIAESTLYDQDIITLARKNTDANTIYEKLSQRDVQNAADVFKSVYKKSKGKDGYVSLEVNPHLAHDSRETIEEARRLWVELNRPNIMIKVPATSEGLVAIRQLISDGINVNVTLLFGLPRYQQVVEAYTTGLEERMTRHQPVDGIASVASFFLSRIDSLADPLVRNNFEPPGKKSGIAKKVYGQVAISSAKAAYQIYKTMFGSDRFRKLSDAGARPQRLLWASTSTKNPDYPDIKYIEQIIGPETVNTATLEIITAYRDHGDPKLRLEEDVAGAKWIMARLPELGLSIDILTQELEDEGIRKFIEPFDNLTNSIRHKSTSESV